MPQAMIRGGHPFDPQADCIDVGSSSYIPLSTRTVERVFWLLANANSNGVQPQLLKVFTLAPAFIIKALTTVA